MWVAASIHWVADESSSRKLSFRCGGFSETRPLKRQSTLVLGGARDAAICYFCSLNAPLGKAVVGREAKKGGGSSCHLKAHPLSTIGSEGYTTYPSLWTTSSTGLWATQG